MVERLEVLERNIQLSVTDKPTSIARTESELRTPERAIQYLEKLLEEKSFQAITPENVQAAIDKLQIRRAS
jgi:hypothetical protein